MKNFLINLIFYTKQNNIAYNSISNEKSFNTNCVIKFINYSIIFNFI